MALKTRSELKAENASDFPDNSTRKISPEKLRGQMDDVVDSARLKEDVSTLHDTGNPTYPSIAIGQGALQSLHSTSTDNYNVGIGYRAGYSMTANSLCVAIGGEALTSCTTGNSNIAIGTYSLWSDTGGRANVAVGTQAMMFNVGGSDNTAIGNFSFMYGGIEGGTFLSNTALGKHSGEGIETGENNVFLGDDAGRITFRSGNGNILLGKSTDVATAASTNQIIIGTSVIGLGNNICTIGMGANRASLSLDGVDTSWAAASDERLKTDIEDYNVGLSFIRDLRPVTFRWRAQKDVPPELSYHGDSDEPCRGQGKRYQGFVAQEIKALIDEHPNVPDGQHLWDVKDGVEEVAPGELIPILVNAVRELAAEIDALKRAR